MEDLTFSLEGLLQELMQNQEHGRGRLCCSMEIDPIAEVL